MQASSPIFAVMLAALIFIRMMTFNREALAYHRRLPRRIRQYLNERGIPDEIICRFKIGWNGTRITIPVYGRDGRFAQYRLARDPDARSAQPKMMSTLGSRAELYGWERVLEKPEEIVVCEGEFDRLVLEAQGFCAVTSTGGSGVFQPSWAELFKDIPRVYLCFDLDEAGRLGERKVAELIPHALSIQLPVTLGIRGDVTDFFLHDTGAANQFRELMEHARPLVREKDRNPKRPVNPMQPPAPSNEASLLKSRVSLEWIARHYVKLTPVGERFKAQCPFHEDRTPSFYIFPDTQCFYCFGCKETGDAITFLMKIDNLSFPEALTALKRFIQP